jgi:putative tryptophan/tyrosine transport system substrate-binding protein
MKRRELVLAGAALVLAARAASAQGTPYRVGLVTSTTPDNPDQRRFLQAFAAGMKELGYSEGRDYTLAVRFSAGQRAKIASLADELIAWPADVLVANVVSTAVELKKKTASVPIIMVTAVDAVGEGWWQAWRGLEETSPA